MNDAAFMIAVTEAREAAKDKKTLNERLTAAMKTTKDHWMLTDEDGRFRAAVGAVLLLSETEDKERIEVEIKQLKTLSAMMSGVPIDFERIEELENPIGLMKMWHKIKEG